MFAGLEAVTEINQAVVSVFRKLYILGLESKNHLSAGALYGII